MKTGPKASTTAAPASPSATAGLRLAPTRPRRRLIADLTKLADSLDADVKRLLDP